MEITSLHVKLASIIVHYEEFTSANGHLTDKTAIDGLRADPEVRGLFAACRNLSLLPVKRETNHAD